MIVRRSEGMGLAELEGWRSDMPNAKGEVLLEPLPGNFFTSGDMPFGRESFGSLNYHVKGRSGPRQHRTVNLLL